MPSPTRPAPGSESPWTPPTPTHVSIARGAANCWPERDRWLASTPGCCGCCRKSVLPPRDDRRSHATSACKVRALKLGGHKIPVRHRGTDVRSEYATLLLLPWPLRVRASDFHPVEGSLQRLTNDPLGFFEFAPAEGLDLDLLDRVLVAARQEAGSVDVVVLPESAVDEQEIDDLETLLQR